MNVVLKTCCPTALLVLAASSNAVSAHEEAPPAKIVLPEHKVLGKDLGAQEALDFSPEKRKAAIYPKSIQFDLDGTTVYGLIASYPEEVGFEQLLEAVNGTQRKWWRDEDRTMAAHGVSVWRNEQDRFVTQVSGNEVIMIWLDRRVTESESKQMIRAITEAYMQEVERLQRFLS